MLFGDEELRGSAMHSVNFYSLVKKVIIRSGGTDKAINLRIFVDLIHELRIKLNITKDGFGPEKTMREINFGLEAALEAGDEGAKRLRKQRMESIILMEFNMINISRVQNALEEAE